MGVHVIGIIGAGGMDLPLAGARCSEVKKKGRERKKRERGRRGDPRKEKFLRNIFLGPFFIAWCSTLQQAEAKEEQSTRVGPTDNFEQSKEKN